MTRAEEAAMKAYPPKKSKWESAFGLLEFDPNKPSREAFIQGYEQAEKDLALTWEDAQLIFICTKQVMGEFDEDISLFNSTQELYEEVLRRYRRYKEAKQ